MFKLGSIKIGKNCTPLVIPEIGINHGGSLSVAMEMVDAAKSAGAKLIKHQTHIAQDEMSELAKKVIPGNSKVSIFEVMESCALTEEEEIELMNYVKHKGLEFLSTPFSRGAADRLERMGVAGYKIGSGELNNYPLIKHIASFQKPMILSTGMNDIAAVEKAVNILEQSKVKYALLHTTNLYPTAPKFVRLGAMVELMEAFPDVPIGLSDHTLNNNACIAAVGLGAAILERHFTDHKNRVGNDIICSMDEKELSELILASKEVFEMRGGKKVPLIEEQITMDFAFATVVTIKDIKMGETLTTENIWVKRPGTGKIKAEEFHSCLGKKVNQNIASNTHLTYSMFEE